jgi:hypothetical protein
MGAFGVSETFICPKCSNPLPVSGPEPKWHLRCEGSRNRPMEPTGWILQLHRASGSSTLTWGPFATMEEANTWALANGVMGAIRIPLYLDVDWMR